MECEVCMLAFDMEQHRPKVLPCGHTLCLTCVRRTNMCHMDRKVVQDVDTLPDNFYILSFIEAGKSRAAAKRFYCLTCKAAAQPICEDEHDICSMKKVRQDQTTANAHTVRLAVELQERIVTRLVTLLPVVAEGFNRMVAAATERQDALQRVLQRVESLAETGSDQDAWLDAAQALSARAARCEQERPGLERLLAVLEHRGTCRLDLDLDLDGAAADQEEGRTLIASSTVDLVGDSEVTRGLRFILYLLSTSGNLVEREDDSPAQGSELDSDWEDADEYISAQDPSSQGAACQELLSSALTSRVAGRGRGIRYAPPASLPGPSWGRGRAHVRSHRRFPVNKENYELIKTLEDQDAVPAMEPFDCPVCLEGFQAGEGLRLKGCLHVFCRECLRSTVEHSGGAQVKCPYQDETYSCDSVLSEREIRAMVPPDLFQQHLERSIKEAESSMDNTFHCKTVDCSGWCEYEPGVNQFVCPVCMQQNCLQCQVIHDPENCREYQDRIKREAATDAEARATQQALEDMLATGNAMRCPKCNVVIMKRSGCDALVCAMCKINICWATKGPRWGPAGVGDTSAGCRCRVNGTPCHPRCGNCH